MKRFAIAIVLLSLCCAVFADDKVTFVYYADSRAGVFDNWHQVDHEKFTKKIATAEKTKYLIFGGDNVWLGFEDKAWKRFFEITDVFVRQGMNIYPAIGNHELILSRPLYDYIRRQFPQTAENEAFSSHEKFIEALARDYDASEPTELYEMMERIYPEAQKESLQILATTEKPGEWSTGWERFKKYVDQWPHLKTVVQEGRNYYTFSMPIGNSGLAAKFIVMDSNNYDEAQKNWVENEKRYSNGPVIFVCHHPRFYPEKSWTTTPCLWLVGHEHDYERRSQDAAGSVAPIHIISGSGGAPLKSGKPHCDDAYTRVHKNWFNYLRVTITPEKIHIETFGCAKIEDPLQKIDDLEFSWKK